MQLPNHVRPVDSTENGVGMAESGFAIQIQGKATTYNAVSNFYNNLTGSPYFQGVVLGPISSIPDLR